MDAAAIYWTNSGAGTVMKAALDGTNLVALASGQSNPDGIAVDASAVYWANLVANGTAMKVPLAGGAPVTLALGQSSPTQVAVRCTGPTWAAL